MLSKLPRKKRIQVSTEDVIFEKINRISAGNPGVAIQLWESSLKDRAISLSAVKESTCTFSLDINESFIISTILSLESVQYGDLDAIAGGEMDIDRVLYRLLQLGIVAENNGCYGIPPPLLKCVTEYLKKTRRLW
jgi:hypothetical protein